MDSKFHVSDHNIYILNLNYFIEKSNVSHYKKVMILIIEIINNAHKLTQYYLYEKAKVENEKIISSFVYYF